MKHATLALALAAAPLACFDASVVEVSHGDLRAPAAGSDASGPVGEGREAKPPHVGEGEGEDAPATWRPFSDDSPWNTPIAADAAVAPDSDTLIDDFMHSSPWGVHLDVNIEQYSIPIFYAESTTPTRAVRADLGGQGWGAGGFDAVLDVPVPAGALPDQADDHHIAILDVARGVEYGCWATDASGGEWNAGLCAATDLRGDGVRPLAAEATPWWDAHGARACGFPLVAGAIRPDEIEAGHIPHALVVAYSHIRAGIYTAPASTAQAAQGEAISSRGIPCGGRIQLDPSVDVDSLDLTPAGKIIARALQEYGAFVGDYSGAISLYADNSPNARAAWEGVLTSDVLHSLDMSQLRVLELGEHHDNGNGG